MATKTISITEEAYKRLAALKEGKESFSDVVFKVTKRNDLENLKKLHGILKGKAGEELEKNILESRKKLEKEDRKRIKRQIDQWRS